MMALAVAAPFMLGACATSGGDEPAGPPSLALATGSPASPQMQFYSDCVAQARSAHTMDREGNLIRFHCDGAPAQAFFDGLSAWSSTSGSEITADGATWRFTSKIQRDPSGLDFCRHGAAGYDCTIVLNAGEFIAQP